MVRQSHLSLTAFGELPPGACSSFIIKAIYTMLSWHIWQRPLLFHWSHLRHEHASKSLSSFLLIWIYLFHWQWWDGWRNCLQWVLCSLQMMRTMMRMTNRLCPADSWDGRIYGLLCPSSSQNTFSLGISFSLSLLYWSHSSQVHIFRVPGASVDRREI